MPTYTYECRKCGHTFDVFHAMSANPRPKCSECAGSCKRLMGTGSGIIFKGSGFYETDYKKRNGNSQVTQKTSDQKSSETSETTKAAASNGGASESKSESKSDRSKSKAAKKD